MIVGYKEVGKQIQNLRKEKNLSQEWLADKFKERLIRKKINKQKWFYNKCWGDIPFQHFSVK